MTRTMAVPPATVDPVAVNLVTVGLDGTPESRAAAGWAADEALLHDAPLQLLQVQETGPRPGSPVVMADETERAWSHQITSEVFDDLTHRFPGLRVTVTTASGRPSHALAGVSADTGLLVLGSRGPSSVVGRLLGSTALATVAHAACPVVLVRAADEGAHGATATGGPPRPATGSRHDVVLGLDLGRPCGELIAFAFRTASLHSAPLRVVHCWELPPVLGGTYPVGTDVTDDWQRERTRALAEAVRPWQEKFPGVAVDRQAPQGHPAELLTEAAEDASVLVVGRRIRHSRVGTHLGPVDLAVMHHVRTPVAVVAHA